MTTCKHYFEENADGMYSPHKSTGSHITISNYKEYFFTQQVLVWKFDSLNLHVAILCELLKHQING